MEVSQEELKRYEELQVLALDFARVGKTQDLKAMLEAGMSVNLTDHKGNTLLMLSSYNGNFETTKMLLEYGAEVDKKNDRGQTPLAGVCFKGYFDIAKRYDHRVGNDDFSQPRALFLLMSNSQKEQLFSNIKDAMAGVPRDIVDRQIALFEKVHPDYAAGVKKALGI